MAAAAAAVVVVAIDDTGTVVDTHVVVVVVAAFAVVAASYLVPSWIAGWMVAIGTRLDRSCANCRNKIVDSMKACLHWNDSAIGSGGEVEIELVPAMSAANNSYARLVLPAAASRQHDVCYCRGVH